MLAVTHTISIDRENFQRAGVERELRDWERQPELWRAPTNPIPIAFHPRRTATASWERSVVIITTLSTLGWALIVLLGIRVLANL